MLNWYDLEILRLEKDIEELPKGTLTYKKIKGKAQPYLQWTENGKAKSRFLKLEERDRLILQVEERKSKKAELHTLKAYYKSVRKLVKQKPYLANRNMGIGVQSFAQIIENKLFYIDKTRFIKQWWERGDEVTLITRPRRFGKTLTLDMLNCFFSMKYAGREDLFENLEIWNYKKYQKLQGTYPTVFLSLAAVKTADFQDALGIICLYLQQIFGEYDYLANSDKLNDEEKWYYHDTYQKLLENDRQAALRSIHLLSQLIEKHHQKKVILLLDEYDAPLQEAYGSASYGEMSGFIRNFFNASIKSNSSLGRTVLTGITKVGSESIFSDMNHLVAYTVTSKVYADVFGFTEDELQDALACLDVSELDQIKIWYDGFCIGNVAHIYNPWSLLNYLSFRELKPYWVNTSSHGMLSKLIINAGNSVKEDLGILLCGECLEKEIDESLHFGQLMESEDGIWSLLLASGYITPEISGNEALRLRITNKEISGNEALLLRITNKETKDDLQRMVREWFSSVRLQYNKFCQYLLLDDLENMNAYLSDVAMEMVSYFDVGCEERFYHGLVLGMLVELKEEYQLSSNRESGYGRYDVLLKPLKQNDYGIIIEFKVRNPAREENLEATAIRAIEQIEEKEYERDLLKTGLAKDKIRKYGFAFEGKNVLIKRGV